MKNYTITVNGNVYNVTIEEGTTAGAPMAAPVPTVTPVAPAPAQAAPAAAPVPAAAPAPAASAGGAGALEITASVPGKICKVVASAGQAVKNGDTVVILEAMKMEIPIVAPQDGTIAGINVSVGDSVESGDMLATMD